METLTYSSNQYSQLNDARRQLWSSKYMLGMENQYPGEFAGKSFWMTSINRDRATLRAVAKRYKARLAQRYIYKVPMVGEASTMYITVIACSADNAAYKADQMYMGHFTAGEPINMGKA